MIPVSPKAAAPDFAQKVAGPGNAWLAKEGYDLAQPLPKGAKPPPLWRHCLPQLHACYDGVCAYLCVYIELTAGGGSVDHFIAKSALAGGAYDWSNYRLACSNMNARKGVFDDVLDPFTLPRDPEVFHLELVSGRIYVNPSITKALAASAEATISRLDLDSGGCRSMRVRHFDMYASQGMTAALLQWYSPFVYGEADRQGLL